VSETNFNLIHVRVTFRNIPIYKISSFSFKDILAACEAFKQIPDVSECVIVQTASRVEIFLVVNLETGETPDARRSEGKGLVINKIEETWKSLTELDVFDTEHFDQTLELYKNTDVYRNLLRLACGLESLVLGKQEILNEMKADISRTKEAKASGKILNKLFDTTIRIATKIRDSTAMGKDVQSIGELGVKLVEDKAGLDNKKKVLLIGTGELAARVAKSLIKREIAFDVTSMTIERATGFSKLLAGTPVNFEDVISGFDKYDIIFVATTADYFLIGYNKIKRIMEKKRKGTMILDLSDPRAVDDGVSTIPGIKLMFRDQIAEIYEEIARATMAKVPAVEKMIIKEAPIIEATIKRLEAEPIVKDSSSTTDLIRQKELKKALEMLGETDENKIKIIEELTKNVAASIAPVPAKKPKES